MYYTHFGLKEPPFKITPNTEFFYSGGNRGAVLEALMYAVTTGEGIIKVVGEVGSGKTMLCRMLQSKLPSHIESVYLANPSVAPEDVLHAIAFELQLALPEKSDRLQVMQVLQKYLLDRHAQGKQVVIFVEEAQGMPLATLEEIRLLTNLETKHDKLLQIVLFGQPELDINLNANQIRQLRERITHSFYLGPLDQKAIGEYLNFRLRAAGYHGPELFKTSAVKWLSHSAQGLIRRVNILADKAMLAAFSENTHEITEKHVMAAIQDSEFGIEQLKQARKRRLAWSGLALISATFLIAFTLNHYSPNALHTSSVTTPAAKPINATQTISKEKVISSGPEIIMPEPKQPEKTIVAPASAAKEVESNTTTAPSTPTPKALPANLAVTPSTMPPAVPDTSASATKVQTPASVTLTTANTPTSASSPKEATSNEPPAQPSNASTSPLLENRIQATLEWMKQQPASTASIQLMGSANEAQLQQHLLSLSKQISPEMLFAYRTKVNGQPFVTVLYGSFTDKAAAQQGMQNLPNALKSYQPHLRTIAGIVKETNQFQ